ncbi:Ribonucleotide-diphosphate reductase subunit beta [Candidatus Filomicrobium marinum]|uniref:Ribonucleotide-diphosphate reductase subunit beta n=2 Tax=Filomicrobium TaxID=119044 RepID=A0A0D6J9E1_9HYPH|nr:MULTISPECIES: 50S ribosomal protein L11 methyltransferase [Filomicrobium]MCV0368869.1 50S ribosomal protein L11 methyltransferase [Filomicrobium sp.]CFW97570.1 Ribonucleotide-diphosphate reductase subunit beta [Candidatus Filomicrobium marinum]CPR14704.1 Ribonucleotide-diphosphate reductase subunit beta [Candidatus Filomicrobium marinum]SDO76811.1 protein arginine N-methyltransferase 1 [Filomicrobium insigne]
MRIEYHRTLIADTVRNVAFHRALKALIEPGETVVADIGAGTGLLGVMAAQLGAKEIFLYEVGEVASVAERTIARSGFDNCHLMPCHSTEMYDPPKVDLIVSETLGNYAFEEDIIATLNDARRRFLKKGGKIIPRAISQFVQPVIGARLHRELTVWGETGKRFGLDLTDAQLMSLNNVYVRRLRESELLEGGQRQWDHVDLSKHNSANRSGEASWSVSKESTVYGFAVWWQAELIEGVSISTGPGAAKTHWEQLYFPLERPLEVPAKAQLKFAIGSKTSPQAGTHLKWQADVLSGTGSRLDRVTMDLDRGYLP